MAKVYIQILTRVCIEKNYTFVAGLNYNCLIYLLPSIHDTYKIFSSLEQS